MLAKLKNLLKAEIDPAFAKRAGFILKHIEAEKPKYILDAGCGRGFYLKALTFYPFLREIHGVDINNKYLKVAKNSISNKRIRIQKASIYDLPYPKETFDLIIASEILEHLKNDKKALLELNRVLKKGGKLLISVPNRDFPFLWDPLNWILMKIFRTHVNKNIWWLAGIWADHERLYKNSELIKLVEEVGFKVEKVEKYIRHCWPFSHFLLYGIGKNIVERLGNKEFDRFNFEKKTLAVILSRLFALPSRFDSKSPKKSVSIVLKAVKI